MEKTPDLQTYMGRLWDITTDSESTFWDNLERRATEADAQILLLQGRLAAAVYAPELRLAALEVEIGLLQTRASLLSQAPGADREKRAAALTARLGTQILDSAPRVWDQLRHAKEIVTEDIGVVFTPVIQALRQHAVLGAPTPSEKRSIIVDLALSAIDPRWTPQNRPLIDTAKPAIN